MMTHQDRVDTSAWFVTADPLQLVPGVESVPGWRRRQHH
jgi:hypothetical protein